MARWKRLRNTVVTDTIHVAVATLSVMMNIETAMTILFVTYQLTETEKYSDKLKDFIEFGIGLIIGGVLKCLLL